MITEIIVFAMGWILAIGGVLSTVANVDKGGDGISSSICFVGGLMLVALGRIMGLLDAIRLGQKCAYAGRNSDPPEPVSPNPAGTAKKIWQIGRK
ncbi:MAG TPA: hypothetical protein VMY35_10945 [Phycisphaerae bacterium]|nr:hypothetical protein [Phycisphaerae bacterium]